MSLLSMVLVLFFSATASAEPGHVPKLFVSTDWGAQLLFHDNLDASGGLTATLRQPRKNVLLYLEGRTLFLGGNFGGRVGMIVGPSYTVTNSDTKIDSITSSYSANGYGGYTKTTTYSGTTTTFHGQEIRGVAGLALSASANTSQARTQKQTARGTSHFVTRSKACGATSCRRLACSRSASALAAATTSSER